MVGSGGAMSDYAGKRSTTQDPGPAAPGAGAASPGKHTLVEAAFTAAVQRRAAAGEATDSSAVHAAAARGTATPSSGLPHGDAIQRAFGRHDVSGVQAHTGSEAAESAGAMGATAYATGDHVVLGGGADLHTVAHEAAHVVQQRAGVHLSGGVGRAGDPYEQHADAVADLVVQGKSAEAALDPYAGAGGGSGAAVQRESAYDGLMPGHDTFRDSYTFNGAKATDFTYHHIIPENKLKKVTAQLQLIRNYFSGGGQQNARRGAFDNELGGMLTDAKKGWLDTRVKNTTFYVDKQFNDYGMPLSESQVREILEDTAEDLDPILGKFQSFYKTKLKSRFEPAPLKVPGIITEALKSETFYTHVCNQNEAGVRSGLAAQLDTAIYDIDTIIQPVMDAIAEVKTATPGAGKQKTPLLNKGTLRGAIASAIRGYDFDTYFRLKFPPLYSTATTDGTLKRVLQTYALPHDDSEHLQHAVQWNPANVHRGPDSEKRLSPKSGQEFNELVDDGGDAFEKAAANLVETDHYEALVALNNDIDEFLKTPVGNAPSDTKLDDATSLVHKMHAVMEFGTTKFKENQWEMKGDKHMRLKKDEDKLRAAELID
jgi:hypothetical protein